MVVQTVAFDCHAAQVFRFKVTEILLLNDQKVMKALSDEDFCETCNSIINMSITENFSDEAHIEACRTLDIILPETKHKNFDYFLSILQINRKKRLKILLSLSILKDETVAIIASKLSILSFLHNCMESVQPKSMPWLQPENADNIAIMKNADNKALSENEEFEERVVERTLELICRLCNLSNSGLSIKQFDTFIMEKVIPLAFLGNRRQRTPALAVLQQAVKNDLGTRVRSFNKEIWDKYKNSLQTIYCKRMTLLVNEYSLDWAQLWETSISLIGTDLHRGSVLVNSLLKVEELAFKSGDPNRRQAFLSWKFLIDNFALDPLELATKRRLKLLCVPLNAKNSKTELMVLTKMEVWWHLIYKIYPSLAGFTDEVLIPFLTLCFGPFGDKPLFVQINDSNVSLGKKYYKTQIFSIGALVQLLVPEDQSKIFSSFVNEKLPNPVNNAIFEKNYKIFIYSFGESIITLGLLSDDSVKNKSDVCKIMWNSLITRIEGYDKMKITMYKEILNVLNELIRNQFHKIPLIKDFLLNVVLKNFDNIARNANFTENILLELANIFIHVDCFPSLTKDHFKPLESMFRHLLKPTNADIYYPETLELMQKMIKTLDEARKNPVHMPAICEIWCILARIAKKYIEDSQNINEGTSLECNFKTIDAIIAYPFKCLLINDLSQMSMISETWCSLYKQFDFQAELIVSVQPNEILEKTSNMIISCMEHNNKCCDLAAVCADGLLQVVNYDSLPGDIVPTFVHLLKNLTLQCLRTESFATEKVLKTLSSFLLCMYNHSVEKTTLYVKNLEPAVKLILTKIDNKSFGSEILNTCSTFIGLYKRFENGSMDDQSKQLMNDLIREVDRFSDKNGDKNTPKDKSKTKTSLIGISSRKTSSPSTRTPGKENFAQPKVINIEPDSQDFVVINSEVKLDVNRLTDHQKEKLKRRKDDIPAMYNELSVSNSQDSQQLQHWFDAKTKTPTSHKKEIVINNNEPGSTGASPSTFKNITQVLSNDQEKAKETSATAGSSKDDETPTITRESPRKSISSSSNANRREAAETAPDVAKKLDFEEQAEEDQNISPSIIEGKMRRINNQPADDASTPTGATSAPEKVHGRRSLKKCKSSDQQPTRTGRKRQNSDNISTEGVLSIERVKRPRFTDSLEVLNSLDSSSKSEDSNSSKSDGDSEKSISKRQKRENSRLKIDMVFQPVPNRRSLIKAADGSTPVADKKADKQKDGVKSKDDKFVSPIKSKDDKGATTAATAATSPKSKEGRSSTIPSKSKDDKVASPPKVDNSQQPKPVKVTRRSLKGFEAYLSEPDKVSTKTDTNKQKESATSRKSDKKSDNAEGSGHRVTRKSLPGKIESVAYNKKKNKSQTATQQSTQEEIEIEDVTTQAESADKSEPTINNTAAKSTAPEKAESAAWEAKLTSDPDIVESSQEPSMCAKLSNKSECVIKIKKVELLHKPILVEQVAEKEAPVEEMEVDQQVVEDVPADEPEDRSIVPATIDVDQVVASAAQSDAKKTENNAGKTPVVPSTATNNHTSSPKSSTPRPFKKNCSLGGRAAWMVTLVTKQSIGDKLINNPEQITKADFNLTDEVTIVPLKKDKPSVPKDNDRVASPLSSRQSKMFNNMNNLNNLKTPERSSSPSMAMFCNLKNDGERISPKLEKHMQEKESEANSMEKEPLQNTEASDSSEDSPKKRELPILEWSNANPPSLTASPSASILKRIQECDIETPGSKKKRVSFADPPVSREMGYEIMTDASSPVRLEKLPSARSPVSHGSSRRSRRRIERENEFNTEEKSMNKSHIPASPKVKLLSKMESLEEKLLAESQVLNTQDDMFEETSAAAPTTSESNNIAEAKASNQNEQSDSSIKLDSINISNIQKSDITRNNSLEDTVDINNLSTSLNSTHNVSMDIATSQPSRDQTDTLPVTDSVFSNPALTQESQSSVAQLNKPETLDSTQPVYPMLTSCSDAVDSISAELVDPMFVDDLAKHFSMKSIRSVGDLAQLTEREVNRLPIIGPKVACVKRVLSRYEEKLRSKTPEKKMKTPSCVSSSTPLEKKRSEKSVKLVNDTFEELIKSKSSELDSMVSDKRILRSPKRSTTDNSIDASPAKKQKIIDEKICATLIQQCDHDFVLNQFAKRFDFEEVLQGYKINSADLLSILAKNLSQEKEKGMNGLISETNDIGVILENVSNNVIIEEVKSRADLKSSEELLDVILKNCVDKLSLEKKRMILKTVAGKFDPCELFDVCTGLVKTELHKVLENKKV